MATVNNATITSITNDTGTSSSDFITSDQTLTFGGNITQTFGQGQAHLDVYLSGGSFGSGLGTKIGTANVNGNGAWSVTYATTIPQGNYTISITDGGHTSTLSTHSLTVDTTGPSAALAVTAISQDTGAADFVTSDTSLSVSGTHGSLSTGEKVQVSTNGGSTWTDVTSSTSTTWSYTDPANHASSFTYQVRIVDAAGNVGTTASQAVTIDTTVAKPGVALTHDTGTADDITSDGSLALSSIETNAKVEYSVDNGTTWTNSFTAVEGNNTVLVRQTDVAANVSGSTSFSFTLDTHVDKPGVALDSDTGAADGVTSDGTLVLSGVETNAKVEYSVDNGTTWTNSFTAVEGDNTVLVRQTDVAGNVSGSTSFSFTLDTHADQPGVALDNDTSGADGITSDGTLALSGVETDATVEYSIDNGATWTGSFSPVEGDNTVLVRQTDVAGNVSDPTSFSFTLDTQVDKPGVALDNDTGAADGVTSDGTLALTGVETDATVEYSVDNGTTWTGSFSAVEGDNTVLVRQTDVAGNVSDSTSLSFTLDTQASAPDVALDNDTGAADGITSDGTLALSGIETDATVEYSVDNGTTWTGSFTAVEGDNTVLVRQTDVAGNVSDHASLSFTLDTQVDKPGVALDNDTGATDGITSDGTLVLTGVETDATIEYSIDSGTTWTASFTPEEGDNTVLVRQTDVAGNVSDSTSFSFTLDTQVDKPGVALDSDTGAADGITSDGTLALTGVETNASVEYSIDNGTTWTGSFSAVEGDNTVMVRQTDVAGNVSDAASFSFTLDTQVDKPGVALDNDTGAADGVTSDGAITVSGIETDATVEYSVNNGTTWTTAFTAAEGTNAVLVRQTDVAGNVSDATSLTFTLDTQAAAPGVSLASDTGAADGVTSNGTLALSGVETNAAVEYSLDNGTTWTGSFSAVEGDNTVKVRQTDVAGNVSGSTTFSFTLDTQVAAPGVALVNDTGAVDGVTSDGALALSGLETNATVQYSVNGGTTWTSSFAPVEGDNTVLVRQTDVAGNVSDATSFSFTLDSDAGSMGLHATFSKHGVALTGTAGPQDAVSIYDNGGLAGTVTSGSQGTWAYAAKKLSNDVHTFTVGATDKAGNSASNPDTATLGSTHADKIHGGNGADVMLGGRGADKMYAGADDATDVFVFNNKHDSGFGNAGPDQIFQFDRKNGGEAHSDKLDFSALDADSHQKGDQSFRFVDHFQDAKGKQPDGQIMVDDHGKNVKVLVDLDGDNHADMTVEVMNVDHLHKADFLL